MTRHQILRVTGVVALGALFVLIAASCGAGLGGSRGVPDSVTVELPDGSTVDAQLGAGVPSLADSSWEFYITGQATQSLPFVVISFGSQGNLERFDGNTIAREIFGDTILFDGHSHATAQAGLSYVAGTYGAETSDATGFAFEGRLTAYAAGITAATATASASGTFDSNDPDTMTGGFSFQSEVVIASIPNANMSESFSFIAHRATGD